MTEYVRHLAEKDPFGAGDPYADYDDDTAAQEVEAAHVAPALAVVRGEQEPAPADEDDNAPIGPPKTQTTAAFPTDAFPGWVADMVDAVAENTQTDSAMAGMAALSVLAAAVAGYVKINSVSNHTEELTLYTATVAHPGERKSSVMKAMTEPLRELQQELVTEVKDKRAQALAQARIEQKAADQAEKVASMADLGNRAQAIADAQSAVTRAEQARDAVPARPRLLVDDVTPEELVTLMEGQGGRIALLSAEGGVFGMIAGRYSREPNIDVYLKGYDGEPIDVDRRGGEPISIERAVLAIGVALQPGVIAKAMENSPVSARGLIQRFSFAQPPSRLGHRKIETPPIPDAVTTAYRDGVRKLVTDGRSASETVILTLSPAARRAYADLAGRVEPLLEPESNAFTTIIEQWRSKHVGRVMRIAGLIHVAQCGVQANVAVQPHAIEAADRIGEYLWETAESTFAQAAQTEEERDAQYLLDRIRARFNMEAKVKTRDLLRAANRFKTAKDLAPIRIRLVDAGYLEPVKPEKEGQEVREWTVTGLTGQTS